jgi:hypothetical protein
VFCSTAELFIVISLSLSSHLRMKLSQEVNESTPLKSWNFSSYSVHNQSEISREDEYLNGEGIAQSGGFFSTATGRLHQSTVSFFFNHGYHERLKNQKITFLVILSLLFTLVLYCLFVSPLDIHSSHPSIDDDLPFLHAAWSSKAAPFSTVDPQSLNVTGIGRPSISMPSSIFNGLLKPGIPLPTNSWYENFLIGTPTVDPDGGKVFQVPYILDVAGKIPGIRTHACHVQAFTTQVMMTHELDNGLTLGALEGIDYLSINDSFANPIVHSPSHLHNSEPVFSKIAIELEWSNEEFRSKSLKTINKASGFRVPIVRGSPYTSVLYFNSTPYLYAERVLKGPITIDQGESTSVFCKPFRDENDIAPSGKILPSLCLSRSFSCFLHLLF